MFSNFIIALFISGGLGVWIYTKIQRSSGGNTKSSAIAATITAVILTVIITIVLQFVFKHTK
jgi:ABC-type spermidine/putrescine transport system permease subunit II